MDVPLTALDMAYAEIGCFYALQFAGRLQQDALAEGLQQALRELPIFAGHIEKQHDQTHSLRCPEPGSYVPLTTSSSGSSNEAFSFTFSYHEQDTQPQQDTYWRMWLSGALPRMGKRLSAARATYYKDRNRTLLVFVWLHTLCDVRGAQAFLASWLRAAHAHQAAGSTDLTPQGSIEEGQQALLLRSPTGSDSSTDSGFIAVIEDVDMAASKAGKEVAAAAAAQLDPRFERLRYYSRPGAAAAAAAAGLAAGEAAGGLQERPAWSWPPTAASSGDGSSTSSSTKTQLACKEWLSTNECPFPWDPRPLTNRCKAIYKVLWAQLSTMFTFLVWRIPGDMVEGWKQAATAARPLPSGMHYSSTLVTAALLAAGAFMADRERYEKQGRLTVNFVVDCSGGRAGLDIPRDSIGNPSVWGARVAVPAALLAAAAGQPSPDLMYFLRTNLQRALDDPQGVLHKQFAWMAAAREAGLSGKLIMAPHFQQVDEGDISLDALPCLSDKLPEVAGAPLEYGLCRWLAIGLPGFFMSQPAPDHLHGSGVRVEGTLGAAAAAKLTALWSSLCLQNLVPGAAGAVCGRMEAGGYVWTNWECVLFPFTLRKTVYDLTAYLPRTLWELLSGRLLGLLPARS